MPERNVPVPQKMDPRWRDEAQNILDHSNCHSISYFDYERLIECIARAMHKAYHEGMHEGASNPYC